MKKIKKVIFCSFEITHYGGIIENIEEKAQAFRDLGLETDFLMFQYSKTSQSQYNKKIEKIKNFHFASNIGSENNGYYKCKSGYYANTFQGWHLPPSNIFVKDEVDKFLNRLSEEDKETTLLVWFFLPSQRKDWAGFSDWKRCFENGFNQVYSVHDGYHNLRMGHLEQVADNFMFAICSHESGDESLKDFSIKRAFIPRSMNLIGIEKNITTFKERPIDLLSNQMFKTSKKVEDFLFMMRHLYLLKEDTEMYLSGVGLGYSYHTTKDKKTPVGYYLNSKNDPDWKGSKNEIKIWSVIFEQYKAKYLGLLTNEEVKEFQKLAKLAVDFSVIPHYGKRQVSVYNGIIQEAICNGAVPLLVRMNVSHNSNNRKSDEFDLTKKIEGCEVLESWTPKERAEHIHRFLNETTQSDYLDICYKNQQNLRNDFDVHKNMKKFLHLIESGEYKNLPKGEATETVLSNSKEFDVFFNKK